MTPKRREQCILLLDDCFDSVIVKTRLEAVGYVVESFKAHFSDSSGHKQTRVKDSRVISFCAKHGYLLLTTDHEMKRTFAEELKATDIGVVATASNQDGLEPWLKALQIAKPKILRDYKKHQRPYFSVLSKSGQLNTECLTSRVTRRTRRSEKESAVQRSARIT